MRLAAAAALLALLAAPASRAQESLPPATTGPACVGDSASGTTVAGDTTPFARTDVKAICERITCYCGCPHLQVSKCFCGTAEEIRNDVAARIDSGQSTEAILAAYVQDHGTWVLAVPPREGFNWIIWVGPVLLVVLGTAMLLLAGRAWRRPAPVPVPASLDGDVEARLRAQLARELGDS